MTDRTLDAAETRDAIRKPTYEQQEAAIAAGYGSVRDWALDQCIEEIHRLKDRMARFEAEQ